MDNRRSMTWEEKFDAIQALDWDASLKMRKPGDWYVLASICIAGDGMLTSVGGNGFDPQTAVENWWRNYVTELKLPLYCQTTQDSKDIRVRWNGYRWADVPLNNPRPKDGTGYD